MDFPQGTEFIVFYLLFFYTKSSIGLVVHTHYIVTKVYFQYCYSSISFLEQSNTLFRYFFYHHNPGSQTLSRTMTSAARQNVNKQYIRLWPTDGAADGMPCTFDLSWSNMQNLEFRFVLWPRKHQKNYLTKTAKNGVMRTSIGTILGGKWGISINIQICTHC